MSKAQSAGRTKPKARADYHHGDLRQALIDAALSLAREGGVEGVTVREAARRAGVSPAAPFRHFKDKSELMTAVAEEATGRLASSVRAKVPATHPDDPTGDLLALGAAYLAWTRRHPTHFEIVSKRSVIDFEGAPGLQSENRGVQELLRTVLANAAERRSLQVDDVGEAVLLCRAFVYGLARMQLDGHFPSWGVPEKEAGRTADALLASFISLLVSRK